MKQEYILDRIPVHCLHTHTHSHLLAHPHTDLLLESGMKPENSKENSGEKLWIESNPSSGLNQGLWSCGGGGNDTHVFTAPPSLVT